RIGNLKTGRLGETVFSETQKNFGRAKSETLRQFCRQCAYLTDCWGECPKNRIIRTAAGEPGLNYLCRGFKRFFAHAIPKVERIVVEIRKSPAPSRPRM